MAKSANDIIQMFTDRKDPAFGPTSGCIWSQRFGNEAASFWISKKQANWVLSVYTRMIRANRNIDAAGGEIVTDGITTMWTMQQVSRRSNNGAGFVKLARVN